MASKAPNVPLGAQLSAIASLFRMIFRMTPTCLSVRGDGGFDWYASSPGGWIPSISHIRVIRELPLVGFGGIVGELMLIRQGSCSSTKTRQQKKKITSYKLIYGINIGSSSSGNCVYLIISDYKIGSMSEPQPRWVASVLYRVIAINVQNPAGSFIAKYIMTTINVQDQFR